MKSISTLALASCLILGGCGAGDESPANNPATNNGMSQGSSAAQELGERLFDSVFLTILRTTNERAIVFKNDGVEGLVDCAEMFTAADYGQATLDFVDGSSIAGYDAEISFDGCVSLESGTNQKFRHATQDASGDGVTETYILNGVLAAATFNEDAEPPATNDYDPSATPTCTNIHFDNILIEVIGVLPDGSGSSNEDEPHNAGAYTEGVLSAECGAQKLRCQLGGATTAFGVVALDAIAEAKGVTSICVFE